MGDKTLLNYKGNLDITVTTPAAAMLYLSW